MKRYTTWGLSTLITLSAVSLAGAGSDVVTVREEGNRPNLGARYELQCAQLVDEAHANLNHQLLAFAREAWLELATEQASVRLEAPNASASIRIDVRITGRTDQVLGAVRESVVTQTVAGRPVTRDVVAEARTFNARTGAPIPTQQLQAGESEGMAGNTPTHRSLPPAIVVNLGLGEDSPRAPAQLEQLLEPLEAVQDLRYRMIQDGGHDAEDEISYGLEYPEFVDEATHDGDRLGALNRSVVSFATDGLSLAVGTGPRLANRIYGVSMRPTYANDRVVSITSYENSHGRNGMRAGTFERSSGRLIPGLKLFEAGADAEAEILAAVHDALRAKYPELTDAELPTRVKYVAWEQISMLFTWGNRQVHDLQTPLRIRVPVSRLPQLDADLFGTTVPVTPGPVTTDSSQGLSDALQRVGGE